MLCHMVCVYRAMRRCLDLIPFYGYCNNAVHRDERNPTNIFVLFITILLYFPVGTAELSCQAKKQSEIAIETDVEGENVISAHGEECVSGRLVEK